MMYVIPEIETEGLAEHTIALLQEHYKKPCIMTLGLTEAERSAIFENLPFTDWNLTYTDLGSDLVATPHVAVIVRSDAGTMDELSTLWGFCTEVEGTAKTVISIGDTGVPAPLRSQVHVFSSVEEFLPRMKYILLDVYRREKKSEAFSKTLANAIHILRAIRSRPGVTTRQLADELEISSRSVQRYIETLRVAGEWIEYDAKSRGWRLLDGMSSLLGDFDKVDSMHSFWGDVIMKNNIFSFATSELSQDAFLCWCLNWYNDLSSPLYPMAEELLSLMGEDMTRPAEGITIWRQWKKIDILVVLQGLNRILIIEDKTSSSEHDDQIAAYRKTIQSLSDGERTRLGITGDASIRTVFFKTGFHYDKDRETVADSVVDGPSFLSALEKYREVKSEILDAYCDHLRDSLQWYDEHGVYTDLTPEGNHWDWKVSQHYIAQHNLMRDLLREKFPETMWKHGDERYKIRIGTNVGGRPWTELTILKKNYTNSEDCYYIFWRIDTDNLGPYISLRFYEWFDKKNEERKARHAQIYDELKGLAGAFIDGNPGLGLRWADIRGGYTGGYKESTLLTIRLEEPLRRWETGGQSDLRSQVSAITDYFMAI